MQRSSPWPAHPFPHRKRLHVLVPHGRVRARRHPEAHAPQVLIDREDRRRGAHDGEVLVHRVVVKPERVLDVQAVVGAKVPQEERLLGREPARPARFAFECLESRELAVRDQLEPHLQVVEQLAAPSADGAGEEGTQLTFATPEPVLTIFGSVW
jgi:hypothetical protein